MLKPSRYKTLIAFSLITLVCFFLLVLGFNFNKLHKSQLAKKIETHRVLSVPLEETTFAENIWVNSKVALTLRQALRLIDQQFLIPDILINKIHINYALKELEKIFPTHVETSLLNNNLTAIDLCYLDNTLKFCKTEKKQNNTSESLVFRLGNRVFKGYYKSELSSLMQIEAIGKAIISQLPLYTEYSQKEVLHIFLNKLLESLDPHSSYLSDMEYQELRNGSKGLSGGMGIVVYNSSGLVVIKEVIKNSPAYKAGVKIGDVILKINDYYSVFNEFRMSLNKLKNYQDGEPLVLYRPSEDTILRISLKREKYPTPSVFKREFPLDPQVLFIRLNSFTSGSAKEIYKIYKNELQFHDLKSMILDLRGNPGGLLEQAHDVANLFLSGESIVSTQTRYETMEEFSKKTSEKIYLPLIILIDAGSASASEIVAAAIQDHGRGLIIGEQSFGKGSVQSLFEFSDQNALKLTIANYYTPVGNSIQNLGVTPDIEIKVIKNRLGGLWVVGKSEAETEKDLFAHLSNPIPIRKNTIVKNPIKIFKMNINESTMNSLADIDFTYPLIPISEDIIELQKDPVAELGYSMAKNFNCLKNVMKICKDSVKKVVEQEKVKISEALNKIDMEDYINIIENSTQNLENIRFLNFKHIFEHRDKELVGAKSKTTEDFGMFWIKNPTRNGAGSKDVPSHIKTFMSSVMYHHELNHPKFFQIIKLKQSLETFSLDQKSYKNELKYGINFEKRDKNVTVDLRITNPPMELAQQKLNLEVIYLNNYFKYSKKNQIVPLFQIDKGNLGSNFDIENDHLEKSFNIVFGLIKSETGEIITKIPILAIGHMGIESLANGPQSKGY